MPSTLLITLIAIFAITFLLYSFLPYMTSSTELDLPWVTLEGDGSEARYMTSYPGILAQGYAKVSRLSSSTSPLMIS